MAGGQQSSCWRGRGKATPPSNLVVEEPAPKAIEAEVAAEPDEEELVEEAAL